ncbi:MAG: NmrA family NAD(P)-binding protein [Bryobacteraceae bacterium]
MYVVSGVSGNTGAIVAQTLIDRGVPVRVVVRKEGKGAKWAAKGAQVSVADLADGAAMTQAFAGAAGAYVLNPPAYGVADPFARAGEVAAALAAAAKAAAVPKLAVLSSVGSQHAAGTGMIRTNHIMETVLRDAAPSVVFVRCAYFMENWAPMLGVVSAMGNLPSFLLPLDRAIPMVSPKDIGRVSADALLEEWNGTRIAELEGPARYSPNDVAAAFAKAVGSEVTPLAVPEAQWSSLMQMGGIPKQSVPYMVEMFQGVNSGLTDFEGAGASHIYGRVTLEEAIAGIING